MQQVFTVAKFSSIFIKSHVFVKSWFNFLSLGPSKTIEALLYEVKRELNEMREEFKSLKENKTIKTGVLDLHLLTFILTFDTLLA